MKYEEGLQLLFIGLKLSNHIDWSWLLVLSPTLLTIGLRVLVELGKK